MNAADICPLLSQRQNLPHPRLLVEGFVKMTENNYVIKEDHIKHETLNQCWADVGPASQTLGQQQPSIGSMSCVCRDSVVSSGHSFRGGGGRAASKDGTLSMCWFNAGPLLATLANVTCLLGGGHGANRNVTYS